MDPGIKANALSFGYLKSRVELLCFRIDAAVLASVVVLSYLDI